VGDEAGMRLYEMPSGDLISQDYYQEINNEQLPGHVSKMVFEQNKYFLLIPEAMKIVVADSIFRHVDDIDFTQLNLKPTDICFANTTTAYVSHRESDVVSEVDVTVFEITDQIEVGKRPVSIAATKNQIYTANYEDNSVSVIDSRTNEVTYTLEVSKNPNFVGITPDGNRFALITYGDTLETNPISAKSYVYEVAEPPELINSLELGKKGKDYLRPISTVINLVDDAHIVTQELTVKLNTIKGKIISTQLKGSFKKVTFSKTRNELYFYDNAGNIEAYYSDRGFENTFNLNITDIDFIYPF
jgi:YVTN family beta-propeller protein